MGGGHPYSINRCTIQESIDLTNELTAPPLGRQPNQ